MMRKYKNTIKKNTKSQLKEIVCEIINFDSTKLTKPKKKSRNTTYWYNIFVIPL